MQLFFFPVHSTGIIYTFNQVRCSPALMKGGLVVELEPGVDSFLQFLHCFTGFKADVLVPEASPQTFNSDVIQNPVFPSMPIRMW